MSFALVPFAEEHIDQAVRLFAAEYRRARQVLPLLPARALEDSGWVAAHLRRRQGPGIAAFAGDELLGYMVTGFQFPFKGEQAAACPEYAHAAVVEDRARLYQAMYMALAAEWTARGNHLHILFHLAGDTVLTATFFQLGFGAILAEQLRDLSPVKGAGEVEIVREKDFACLVDLQVEHHTYYRKSPIFLLKDANRQSVLADLEKHSQDDALLVYYEGGRPAALFIVGESAAEGEGFLVRGTRTAQIKSAYARPSCRGLGIGKALLGQAVEWARERGYERLFVEHETANFYGGNFWRRHFSPYLFVSMRYVDRRIADSPASDVWTVQEEIAKLQ